MVALGAALVFVGGPRVQVSVGELAAWASRWTSGKTGVPDQRATGMASFDPGVLGGGVTTRGGTQSAPVRATVPSLAAWTDAAGIPSASPLPVAVRVSSSFGMRRHPVTGDVRHHDGVDLAAPLGTPALATASGVVSWAGVRSGYGRTVDVRHPPSGLVTRYAHLDAVAPGIAAGVSVSRGAVLGSVGETGLATGPHLHYEVRSPSGPLDPVALHERYRRSYVEARRVYGRAWDRWAAAQRAAAPGER